MNNVITLYRGNEPTRTICDSETSPAGLPGGDSRRGEIARPSLALRKHLNWEEKVKSLHPLVANAVQLPRLAAANQSAQAPAAPIPSEPAAKPEPIPPTPTQSGLNKVKHGFKMQSVLCPGRRLILFMHLESTQRRKRRKDAEKKGMEPRISRMARMKVRFQLPWLYPCIRAIRGPVLCSASLRLCVKALRRGNGSPRLIRPHPAQSGLNKVEQG